MTQINPKKLRHSKWTAVSPQNKEKHFAVTEILFDDEGLDVLDCKIEAVMTKRTQSIDWRSLQDSKVWQQGWK